MCIAEVECKQARAECQQAPDAALSAGGGVKHAVHSQLSPWRPVTLSDPRPRASVAHHLPVASVDHVARAARHQQVRKVFAPASNTHILLTAASLDFARMDIVFLLLIGVLYAISHWLIAAIARLRGVE
jgi:hypothetical protein